MSLLPVSPKSKRKPYIDREELSLYLLWAFVLGIAASLWLCSGCGPPATQFKFPPSTKPPTPISRCHVVLQEQTANVRVTLRHGCLRSGTSDVTFVLVNPLDDGSMAAEDSAFILIKYFGELPGMAPIAITPTPDGNTALVFVILDFSSAESQTIQRDIRLRHPHH